MFNSSPDGYFRALLMSLSGCLALLLCGCGGDMSGAMANPAGDASTPMSCTAASCAPVMLTMTDAKGDFLSYIVTVTSLQLQTEAGASVETVPAASKVDFAQLVDLTEIISAAQIPTTQYVSATLTLDYTAASITADDGTGNPVPLSPVDADNNPLTGPVSVSVQLDNAHHLLITPGRTARLAFDFNLAASNTVNLPAGTVTVSPILVASVVPSDTKPIRVRGQLASASAAQDDFVLHVQPFHDTIGNAGQVTAHVVATTTWQINGTAYVGNAGLAALAALPMDTMVAAFGSLQQDTQTFNAATVFAGTSLQNPAGDLISGTVVGRTATMLTVRGATWSRSDGDFDFERRDVAVSVGANTAVTEEGMMGSFGKADISVGQHIDAFGTATQAGSGTVSMDATAGQVRLDLTPAWGVVTGLAAGGVTVNLQSLDGLPASLFDFAGTGTSAANDAKASTYLLNTGTLSLTGLTIGAPARVIGFVAPFGMAPPDFLAQTLVNYAAVTEGLLVDWGRMGSSSAFAGLSAASTSLQLDLAGTGDSHFVQIGPERLDLTGLATAPMLAAETTAANDVFTIGHQGRFRTENFSTFATFAAALTADLGPMTTVIAVAATGQYDGTTNIFTATRIAVLLNN